MKKQKPDSTPAAQKTTKPLILWILGTVIAAVIPYLPQLRGKFVLDDLQLIVMDPASQSLSHFFEAFSKPFLYGFDKGDALYYRPLITISYQINNMLAKHSACGCRITNMILYAICSMLVVVLLWRLTGNTTIAGVGGIAFAVLPSHAESVSWISGRTDIMVFIFAAGSFLAFLAHQHLRPKFDWKLAIVCSFLFTCALFCKENALVLPVLLALYVWIFGSPLKREEVLKWLVLLVLPIIIYAVLRRQAMDVPFDSQLSYFFKERMLRIGTVYANYLRMMFIPRLVHPVYDALRTGTHATLPILAAWIAPVGLLAVSIWARRRAPIAAFGAGWIFINLLPVADIVPLHGLIIVERVVFLASVGSSLLIGWIVCKAYEYRPKRFQVIPLIVVILTAAYLLYSGALALCSSRYYESNLDWALRVAETKPKLKLSRITAGEFLAQAGYVKEAAEQFDAVIDLGVPGARETDVSVWKCKLGLTYARCGDVTLACKTFAEATSADPYNPQAWCYLGRAKLKMGKFAEATKAYERAFAIVKPDARDLYDSATAYKGARMPQKAQSAFMQVIKHYPGSKYANKARQELHY